ncbi:hypothetical protein RchiOBHm_Chr5g0004171 [Rosa chinensis]|uniref:Uncharacterized protein n=1 Tax=Rosa chinensis TaxID=74649 RepID=A0A2P6Q2Y5_ROSCH|nr:hypothetical protein RchiOBHm_Chr5g0004171 [Rosa chinensis]
MMLSQSLQLGRGKMITKPATTTTRPSNSASQLPSQPALRATSNAAATITQLPFEEPSVDQHPITHNSGKDVNTYVTCYP